GKFGGSLSSIPAAELAAHVMRAVLEKSGLPQERSARTPSTALPRSAARNLRVLSKAVIHQLI
ncbi:MAG TPA: hypothetical protein VGF26_15750, partial [Ramlibacter sp.]